MRGQNGSDSNRQHHGSVLHQQGRGREVGPTVCLTLENLDLVHRETSDSKGPTHSRLLKCSGGQTIQIGADHPNRMVPPSRGFSSPVQQVAPASNRSLCHEIQQQIAPVCITSSGSHGHCSGCTQIVMGKSGRVCLPTDSHIGQSGGKVAGLPIPKVDHHCPGVAQHDMVLGPSGNVQPDSIALASTAKPPDSTLQSDPSQKSDKPKSPCMAPRATAIKEQGFSEAVATGNYSPAPLMVTGQPLLINWETQPSTSAKMKISPASWIVSIETQGQKGYPFLEPISGFTPANKGSL